MCAMCAMYNVPGVMGGCQHCLESIVSVLHQEEGGIGKSIPDAQDFPRPERFPEGEARGKS